MPKDKPIKINKLVFQKDTQFYNGIYSLQVFLSNGYKSPVFKSCINKFNDFGNRLMISINRPVKTIQGTSSSNIFSKFFFKDKDGKEIVKLVCNET